AAGHDEIASLMTSLFCGARKSPIIKVSRSSAGIFFRTQPLSIFVRADAIGILIAHSCIIRTNVASRKLKPKILPRLRHVLAIGVVYFAVILFGRLPDHLILFPTRAPIDAGEAIRKAI